MGRMVPIQYPRSTIKSSTAPQVHLLLWRRWRVLLLVLRLLLLLWRRSALHGWCYILRGGRLRGRLGRRHAALPRLGVGALVVLQRQ